MIHIENFSKFFGKYKAVSDLNCSISPGELIGVIGPNGAGKSTTFKTLATLLKPSSGSITIGQYDIEKESHKVREILGYLPEETPLIRELTVKEYLNFRFSLKYKKGTIQRDVSECMEVCGLKDVQNRVISNLSKGYRQRTGIAECLLGSPEILLLDEPIHGLDPEQIVHIRNLLIQLKKRHTILVSSHILSELELICDKYLIISGGNLKIFGTGEEIISKSKSGKKIVVEWNGQENIPFDLKEADWLQSSKEEGAEVKKWTFFLKRGAEDPRPLLWNYLKKMDGFLISMELESPSLETIYMEMIHE